MPFLAFFLTLIATVQGGSPYRISGEVRDLEGKAAAGVRVSAYIPDLAVNKQRPPGNWTFSGADGKFVINLDRPGKYVVTYDDRDRGYFPQSIPYFRDPNNPPPEVVLSEISPTAELIVAMSRAGFLKGEAIDAQTQLPIDHLEFTMCPTDNQLPCWHTAARSADGKFAVPVPFVPFRLRIASPEFEDWLGLTGSDLNVPVTVPAGTSTPVSLSMKRKPEAANRAINEAEKRIGINLPAPKQLSPDDRQVFDMYPRRTRLEWNPVDGAASYALEIDVCESLKRNPQCINPQPLHNPTSPPTFNITTTSYEFMFVGAQWGRWRVWAVDQEGREGFKSEWRTFVYLR
jgi:hypothetical protein